MENIVKVTQINSDTLFCMNFHGEEVIIKDWKLGYGESVYTLKRNSKFTLSPQYLIVGIGNISTLNDDHTEKKEMRYVLQELFSYSAKFLFVNNDELYSLFIIDSNNKTIIVSK